MKKSGPSLTDSAILRQKAEKLLQDKFLKPALKLSEAEILQLIHKLEVMQIEKELQYVELVLAREQAADAYEKYIELYDFAPSGYFSLSRQGEIMELNLSVAKMLGNVRSCLINSSFGVYISDETKPVFNDFIRKVFNSRAKETCEVTLSNRETLPLEVYLSGIVTEKGDRCLVIMVDITERKKAENLLKEKNTEIEMQNEKYIQINQELAFQIEEKEKRAAELIIAKEHAEESDRLKSAFIRNMGHEIRTPMNCILGYAELLNEPDLTTEKHNRYLSNINKGTDRLNNFMNDIISISKVESGQMELSISNTNVNEQIEFVCNLFKSEAEQKGLQISFRNGLPAKKANIKTDREKIYAILTNLVKNAIKFTATGSIEIGYSMAETLHATSLLEFYVRDTGIGIPNNRQQAIFERFVQAGSDDRQDSQGAGLGLSISKAYVEMLGGRIWVESNPDGSSGGKGSTFYFSLPYITVPEEEPEIKKVVSADETTAPPKKLNILIAEDNEESEILLEKLVEKFTGKVYKARTGIEAVENCRKNPDLDLVLMDMKMPEMDGYEATLKIRQFNKDVIIIAQTAFALSGDIEKVIEAGCNEYLSKPIRRQKLMEMVQKYF